MKFLLLLVALGSFVAKISGQQCSRNEVYSDCGGCDQYCNRDPVFCKQDCSRPGCYCKKGYIRSFKGGDCVKKSKCPISPGADTPPFEQNSGPISPGVDTPPFAQNSGPISPGVDTPPFAQNSGPISPGVDTPPLAQNSGPASNGPRFPGADMFFVEDTGPAPNGPSSFGPAPQNPRINGNVFRNAAPANAAGPGPEPVYACGANEEYQTCGVGWQCEDYCGRGPNACAYCEDGCYCKPGYVRTGPEFTAECIPANQCPRALEPPPMIEYSDPVYACGANEEYQTCGVGWQCEDYCGRGPNACAYCEDGCYCKPGYVRSGPEFTAQCIPADQCPRIQPIPPVVENSEPVYACGANEEFQTCGVGWQCEDYCGRGPNACAYCEDGCYCQPGYVRSGPEFTAQCVPADQCPRAQDVTIIESSVEVYCDVNEVYRACGGCDQFCNSGPIACKQDCSSPGCYCQVGYVRSFQGGVCIPASSCPRVQDDPPPVIENAPQVYCDINEVYNGCGGCDQFCNSEPIFCTQDCSRPGCYCQNGYVRSFQGGICIPASDCPRAQQNNPPPMIENSGPLVQQNNPPPMIENSGPRCGPNAVYMRCGVGSQCENYCGRGPNACAYCEDGCYCKKGYIRSTSQYKSKCIPENQCASAQGANSSLPQLAGPGPLAPTKSIGKKLGGGRLKM